MPSWFMLFLRRYSGLTIKYVRGADPVIKLLDDDESVIEVRNIFFFLIHELGLAKDFKQW